jgi:hypothetical protein
VTVADKEVTSSGIAELAHHGNHATVGEAIGFTTALRRKE